MTGPCPHGLDDPTWCSICIHGPTRTDRAERPTGRPDDHQPDQPDTFLARYYGHCDGCNLPIHVGQHITRWGDTYRHEGCAP